MSVVIFRTAYGANKMRILYVLHFISALFIVDARAQSIEKVLPRLADEKKYYFNCISCSDDHNCTVSGFANDKDSGGYVFYVERTTDGGLSWTQRIAPFASQRAINVGKKPRGVYAVDSLIVFMFGDSGLLARTTDGGENWKDISLKEYRSISAMSFIDRLNGIASGGGALATITRNGGDTWDTIPNLPFAFYPQVKMFSVDTMAIYRHGAGMYNTQDRWKTMDSTPYIRDYSTIDPDRIASISAVHWRDKKRVIGIGLVQYKRPDQFPPYENHPYVLSSSDGGLTWAELYDKHSYASDIRAISILPSGAGIFGGFQRGLLRTTNWGKTWSDDTVITDVNFDECDDIAMLDDFSALANFAVGGQGSIVRITYPKSSVDGLREKVLYGTGVYPNPSANKITVKKLYANDKGYSVIDVVGLEVLKGKLNDGPSTTLIDCSGLPGGTYTLMVKFDVGNLPAGHFVIRK